MGIPRAERRRDQGHGAAGTNQIRAHSKHPLEGVGSELDRFRVGRDDAGGRGRKQLDLQVRAGGCGIDQRAAPRASAIASTSWPGARRIDTFAIAATGRTAPGSRGEPLSIPLMSSDGSAKVRM